LAQTLKEDDDDDDDDDDYDYVLKRNSLFQFPTHEGYDFFLNRT
jgi:hypothetical protein